MIRPSALIAIAAAALTAGCGSLGSTAAAGQPSGSAPPQAPASSAPCTTKACIVTDAQGLKGTVAKDNSVMTKVACKQSTVKQVVDGTYTVHCTITYSDGAKWRGIASVLIAKGEVDWEPTTILDYGSGG